LSEEIQITDYKILTPINIDVIIEGKEVKVMGQLDYANQEIYVPEEFQNMGIETKFFQYLREINTLPSNFYAVEKPQVPSVEDAGV